MRGIRRAATVIAVAAVTTAGQVTTFTGVGANTYEVVAGPDGAMWFGSGNALIGRITTR